MSKPSKKEVKNVVLQLKKLGISKEAIAAELQVSFATVWKWAKEKSAPSYSTYEALLVMLAKAKKKKD